jgi:predicted ABC-type ATPase
MTSATPRLRMFAGPNGSGKSTIKNVIRPELLGPFINPDEIEKELRERGVVELNRFGISTTQTELVMFFSASSLLRKVNRVDSAMSLHFSDGKLSFPNLNVDAYIASVVADFIRQRLLSNGASFSFETVMSANDKVAFLETARQGGYRTYLYYVATEDPIINIARVRNRVLLGGHAVPQDKIVSRYGRSLSLLIEAIRRSNRAYLFDNSDTGPVLVAEITDGNHAELKAGVMPRWFKTAVWDKLNATRESEHS